ncbi:MAG TPA: PilT/PilU family type 4a pilus ATPase [Gemmatimonadales bacterium]|nr:PilT/PilU family type 4a pilus ATPase [Gemmatimonadales bacterium]
MEEGKPRLSRASTQVPTLHGGLEKIIKVAVDRGASDVHIKAGDVFRARIDGKLVPLTKQRLTPEQTKVIALRLLPTDEDQARIDRVRDYDCSWGLPGVGRFRINILRQRSSFMVVMRVIPFDVPSFDSLHLPPIMATIAGTERGLVLVTGPAGAGKSSTLAAIVHHINQQHQRHVVTLENPIEFLHRDLNSSITQREIGVDTDDFRRGLRAALRQDPDVILIGEMRDPVVIDTALRAAETGHLILAALDTPDAATTIARLVGAFSTAEQSAARLRLSDALQASVSQCLLPRADGRGRVAAFEILLATPAVRDLIRASGSASELQELICSSRDEHGMQSQDQHLVSLVTEGVVTPEAALAAALDGPALEPKLRGIPRRTPVPIEAAKVAPAPLADDLTSLLPGS